MSLSVTPTSSSRVRDVDALVTSLAAIVGDRLTRVASELEQHGRGETHLPPAPPDVVVYAMSTDEVSAIVRACAARDVPVIAYGAGSSLEGHVSAVQGGVSLDLSRMDQVLRVSVADLDVTVQAGVTRTQLARALAGTGATFFVDPGADATIGGMIATGASGTTSVRYGTMRENTLALTVVLADGTVIHTGSRARKSSAGYDLTRLFLGSEGTLGIITEATLRLHPVPDAIAAAVCAFETEDAAVDAVIALLQCGVPLARIELVDATTIGALNALLSLGYPACPMIFLELHAFSVEALREQLTAVHAVVADFAGTVHATATTEDDRARLWEARHKSYYACLALRPGARAWTTDACVPVSHLAQCIRETRADVQAAGMIAPLVGHVGDGNFHLMLLLDPDDRAERLLAEGIATRLTARAIAMNGTCSGEHGVGLGKMAALEKQHGDALHVMRAIKNALDPQHILNPGKIVTRDATESSRGRPPLPVRMATPMHIVDELYTMGHEQVLFCQEPAAGYRAIFALHSTALGPAVGGTRLWRYPTATAALHDALRLARGMTYKNAAAGLALGGGKAVILAPDHAIDREAIFLAHGRAVERLGGRFITAEDVGTGPADLLVASRETAFVAGIDGKGGDPSPWTARGVFVGIQAAARHRWGSTDLAGRTVAIQGCGNVGGALARLLASAGATLILSDTDDARVAALGGSLGATIVAPDAIHAVASDIFAPCALGAILNDVTIAQLQATIIAGAANNQLDSDRHADQLAARGVLYAPDFVINAGGVISGSVALLGETHDEMVRRVDDIGNTLSEVFAQAEREGITSMRAAEMRAEKALAAAPHR